MKDWGCATVWGVSVSRQKETGRRGSRLTGMGDNWANGDTYAFVLFLVWCYRTKTPIRWSAKDGGTHATSVTGKSVLSGIDVSGAREAEDWMRRDEGDGSTC